MSKLPDKPHDFLDAAIAAAKDKELVQVEMVQIQVKLMNRDDRPAVLMLPKDTTDEEYLSLEFALLVQFDKLRAVRRPAIEVARQMPTGPLQ